MRVVLIGAAADRERLRQGLAGTALVVAGEAETEAEARAAGLRADAYVSGPDGHEPRPPAAVRVGTSEPAQIEALTPREMEVLELLAEGLPNKAIARRLDISDQTVKFHVAQICGKLGAINRTDAVRRAVRRGLIAL